MKAKYVKPALVMERFELTQSIANGCNVDPDGPLGDPNHYSKATCGWDMGNVVLWTVENAGCTEKEDPDADWVGVCYNNPDGFNKIFGS